jgi:beta-lactamase regulating signal transducer with metallopeptidase domain
MIAHLVLSTVVLAAAMLVARLAPLTARTRSAVLLAGLAKFALPSSAIGALLRVLHIAPVPTAIDLPLRVLGGGAATGAVTSHISWLSYTWAAIAMAIFGRWLILRTRTISAALRTGSSPTPRELDALASARRALNIATPIDLLRSPICEAPAVIRILRPTILLPAHASDLLDDHELRTLLLHECAHVARRDNFLAALETLAASLLWFHPLVWLALRELATAREEACDELVADAAQSTDIYLNALTKICRAVLASRTAGASCMASAHLAERIEHLMNYATLKQKAFSHRAVLAFAAAALISVTTAATAFSFEHPQKLQQIYMPAFAVTARDGTAMFHIEVLEIGTGRVVTTNDFSVAAGEWKTIDAKDGARDVTLRVRARRDGSAEVFIEAKENGERIQSNLYISSPKAQAAPQSKFTGEPISLDLKDADLKDVLNTFAQLTGYDVAMTKDVEGKRVTISVKETPWDEALDRVARDNGLKVTIEGKVIRVGK